MVSEFYAGLLTLLLVASAVNRSTASPLGSAFTYQGQVQRSGQPISGQYDFQFSLWDAVTNGNLAGTTQSVRAVTVSNGLFSTTLDFGPSVFDGSALWLQIGVRSNASGAFVPLSPRQPLTPVPYSLTANSASNVLGAVSAAQLSGTLPPSALAGFSGPVALTNPADVFRGNFTGDGSGLTGLQASNALLSSALAVLAATNCTFVCEGDSQTDPNWPPANWPIWARTNFYFSGRGLFTNFAIGTSVLIGTTNWIPALGTANPYNPAAGIFLGVTNRYYTYERPLLQAATGPKFFFLLIGANDMNYIAQVGAGSYLQSLTEFLRNGPKADGAKVILMSQLSRWDAAFTPTWPGWQARQSWNDLLRATAPTNSAIDWFVDLEPLFSDARDATFFFDGVHLTPVGSKKIADYITATVFAGAQSPAQPARMPPTYQPWHEHPPLRYAPYTYQMMAADLATVFPPDGSGGVLNLEDCTKILNGPTSPIIRHRIPTGTGCTNLAVTFTLLPQDGVLSGTMGIWSMNLEWTNATAAALFAGQQFISVTNLNAGSFTKVTVNYKWPDDLYPRSLVNSFYRLTNNTMGPTQDVWIVDLEANAY